MGGPGDPPEGTPEGGPGGAEDEYRSVVFDESFVRAARLQESSAQERVSDHAPAVRRRPPLHRGLSRQALVLLLLIAVAFATAVVMGIRHPTGVPGARRPVQPLRMTVVPLAPLGKVPGAADVASLYRHSPAAGFEPGADGIPFPAVRATAHFSDSQVTAALTIARTYIVRSSANPDVVTGHQVRGVRALLDGDQLDQFDQSFDHPAADGRHSPTGWVVRLDPSRVELADTGIRDQGTLQAVETDAATLEVTADTVVVYALRPTGAGAGAQVSLFTVRRALTFRFDRDDLRVGQTQLTVSDVEAGPLSCADDATGYFRPLLAGTTARPGAPAGTDPFAPAGTPALCGTLATAGGPKV
ncbi:hypothetical protein [Streptomyces sp. NPDC047028]|uniref:SCO2583 family membrane protein n=1 Tax=Streptomyces sp. NPDC047028 TaxID=3155793 RepID=UPI0033C75254